MRKPLPPPEIVLDLVEAEMKLAAEWKEYPGRVTLINSTGVVSLPTKVSPRAIIL